MEIDKAPISIKSPLKYFIVILYKK